MASYPDGTSDALVHGLGHEQRGLNLVLLGRLNSLLGRSGGFSTGLFIHEVSV